jgi:tight adherence protein C
MVVALLGILFFAAASVALISRAVAMPRVRTAETMGQIDSYGYSGGSADAENDSGAVRGTLDDIAGFVGGLFSSSRLGGGVKEAELRNELMAAGLYIITPRKFLGYRILCAVSVPITWIWLAIASGFPPALAILGLFVAFLAGWVAPMTIVRNRARRRLEQIDYDLPELIDVLVVTVEAGLGFSGSLQVAAERLEGPLGDELRLTLQEQSMGLSTTEALQNMLLRADTPAMRSFVRSIVQGETLGVSIGEIMRNLATEMRKRRRANAEERAQKAPIKILFPLIFLIFPAMFVILLGPAIFQFIEAFGGGGP